MLLSPRAGRHCVTGGADHSLRVYDLASKRLRAELPLATQRRGECHSDWVTACAFTEDGSSLLSGGADGRVLLWSSLSSPREARPAPLGKGHGAGVSALSVHSGRCMTSGYDGALQLWSLGTRSLLQRLALPLTNAAGNFADSGGRLSPVLAFLWKNAFALAASKDGSLALYDVNRQAPRGEPLAFFPKAHRGAAHVLAFTAFRRAASEGATAQAAVSPSRALVASGGRDDGALMLWDVRCMDSPCCVVRAHAGSVNAALPMGPLGEDASLICTLSSNGESKVWELRRLSSDDGKTAPLSVQFFSTSLLAGEVLDDRRGEVAVGCADGFVRCLTVFGASQETSSKDTRELAAAQRIPKASIRALQTVVNSVLDAEPAGSSQDEDEEAFLLKRRLHRVQGLLAASDDGTLSLRSFLDASVSAS